MLNSNLTCWNKRFQKISCNAVVLSVLNVFLPTTTLHAEESSYLDLIEDEAEHLNDFDRNPARATQHNPITADPLAPQEHEKSFIMQVYSRLDTDEKSVLSDDKRYLEQLENEAERLKLKSETYAKQQTRRAALPLQPTKPKQPTTQKEILQLIENESRTVQTSTNIAPRVNKSPADLVTAKQQKHVEKLLKSKIPSIFRFYSKLGLAEKKLVAKEFFDTNKLSSASHAVLNLYHLH
ncbi:hypothetical protein [Kaarinaea lacus]